MWWKKKKRDTRMKREIGGSGGREKERKRGREKISAACCVTHGRRSNHRVRRNRRGDNLARSSHAKGWKKKKKSLAANYHVGLCFPERKYNVIAGSFLPQTITQMSIVRIRSLSRARANARAYCITASANIKGTLSRSGQLCIKKQSIEIKRYS